MAYVIYDIHDGMKLKELDSRSALKLFEDFKAKFGKNFYFRIFSEELDYVFDRGIEYKDETKAVSNDEVYILNGKYKVKCQFKPWPRYIEVIKNASTAFD